MKKFILSLFFLLFLMVPPAFSQTGNTVTIPFNGVPSGSCSFIMLAQNLLNGDLYYCNGSTSTWAFLSSLGSVDFVTIPPVAGDVPCWNVGLVLVPCALVANWSCEIVIGDPGAASAVLANDNDSPGVCKNTTLFTMTITAVACYAPVGSPTVTPVLTAGGAILTGALTCTNAEGGAAGTLSGTPTIAPGKTVDGNITVAGGTAKYLVIYLSGTVPTN